MLPRVVAATMAAAPAGAAVRVAAASVVAATMARWTQEVHVVPGAVAAPSLVLAAAAAACCVLPMASPRFSRAAAGVMCGAMALAG